MAPERESVPDPHVIGRGPTFTSSRSPGERFSIAQGGIPHRPRTPSLPPTAAHPTDAWVPPPARARMPASAAARRALHEGCRRGPPHAGVAPRHWPADRSLAVASRYKDATPSELLPLPPPPPQQSGVPPDRSRGSRPPPAPRRLGLPIRPSLLSRN